MKSLLRTIIGTLVTAAAAFFLSALGFVLGVDDALRGPPGLVALGWRLGLFIVLTAAGFYALRMLLRARGGLALYLVGGAAVGLAAAALSLLAGGAADDLHPPVLLVGLLAGMAGAIPLSGSGSVSPRPTPIGTTGDRG